MRQLPSADFQATLAAARAGEPAALEALFQRFYPRLQRMVHRSLSSRDLRPEEYLSHGDLELGVDEGVDAPAVDFNHGTSSWTGQA